MNFLKNLFNKTPITENQKETNRTSYTHNGIDHVIQRNLPLSSEAQLVQSMAIEWISKFGFKMVDSYELSRTASYWTPQTQTCEMLVFKNEFFYVMFKIYNMTHFFSISMDFKRDLNERGFSDSNFTDITKIDHPSLYKKSKTDQMVGFQEFGDRLFAAPEMIELLLGEYYFDFYMDLRDQATTDICVEMEKEFRRLRQNNGHST